MYLPETGQPLGLNGRLPRWKQLVTIGQLSPRQTSLAKFVCQVLKFGAVESYQRERMKVRGDKGVFSKDLQREISERGTARFGQDWK